MAPRKEFLLALLFTNSFVFFDDLIFVLKLRQIMLCIKIENDGKIVVWLLISSKF